MLEVRTEASELDPNRDTDTQPQSVVTGASDTNKTGETGNVQMNTQQRISEDYAIPEEIASEALLMLQNMSQPNKQELDDNDEYALPVGTERLPDIVSEMNEQRGIKNGELRCRHTRRNEITNRKTKTGNAGGR